MPSLFRPPVAGDSQRKKTELNVQKNKKKVLIFYQMGKENETQVFFPPLQPSQGYRVRRSFEKLGLN